MIFKGTDKDAYKKASRGKTPQKRSKLYQKEKAKNEKRRERKETAQSIFSSHYTPKIPKQPIRIKPSAIRTTKVRQVPQYVEKRTILDDVRDYRSSKIVSNVANSLATFVVRCGGRQWDNDTKNFVRSSIALAISEVTNKVLEKPLEIVDNIKLFIKVGKTIYKIIAWIDKVTNLWVTDDKSVSIVMENDIEYVSYTRQYPRLAESHRIIIDMKYKVGDTVLLDDGHAVRIISVNSDEKKYRAISLGKDETEYIIADADILRLY
ncbi:MAG: hypothetical protein HFK07_06775 [Clostridia bacterium]|nr:hypothetical protein [Clostridia bacterium]